MRAVARMAVLDLRTVAPYRSQLLLVLALMIAILAHNPKAIVPALCLLIAPLAAAQPFMAAEKSNLQTLYDVLPVPRRAVVLGHYLWALGGFATSAAVGTGLTYAIAWAGGEAVGGRTLATMLVLAWGLFAASIAIQLPLLMRFGYSRMAVLATTMPPALIIAAVFRLHLTLASVQDRLPLIGAAGVAVLATSAALAALRPPGPRT